MRTISLAWPALLAAMVAAGGGTAVTGAAQPEAGAAPAPWPRMRAFTLTAGVRLDAPRADIDVPLYDEAGVVRYRLICRGGGQDYLDDVGERTGTAGYQPDLTCILNAGDRETDASLLAEDESPAYYSRGRFAAAELAGDCGRYPEYGLVRHFRLRGMALTLAFSDMTAGAERPVYGLLTVSVQPDPAARTAKAAQTGYLRPAEGACRTVRRGDAPLMCRDSRTSSWDRCPAGWEMQPYPWENRITAARAAPPRSRLPAGSGTEPVDFFRRPRF